LLANGGNGHNFQAICQQRRVAFVGFLDHQLVLKGAQLLYKHSKKMFLAGEVERDVAGTQV